MSTVLPRQWTTPPVMPREAPAAERRSRVHHWLSTTFTGIQGDPLPVVIEFPPSYEPEAGELVELVRGIRDELKTRNHGRVTFVFATDDDVMRDAMRSIAAALDAPIWVAPGSSRLDLAEPALPMTPVKRLTLEGLGEIGHGTASAVSSRTGGSPVSVGNILAGLYDQGLLLREPGAGRTGHTYIHPARVEASPATAPMTTTVEVPRDLSVEISELAERIGRDPNELVAEAWRAFLEEHVVELTSNYARIAGAIQSNDRASLLDALTHDVAARARATRPERLEAKTRASPAHAGQSRTHE